jgi:hypothetical protein
VATSSTDRASPKKSENDDERVKCNQTLPGYGGMRCRDNRRGCVTTGEDRSGCGVLVWAEECPLVSAEVNITSDRVRKGPTHTSNGEQDCSPREDDGEDLLGTIVQCICASGQDA